MIPSDQSRFVGGTLSVAAELVCFLKSFHDDTLIVLV